MLRYCHLQLSVPDLDAEIGKVPHRGANVHQAILNVICTQTRRTDKLFSQQGSCSQVCEAESAIGAESVVAVFVLEHDYLVRRVELVGVERIRDGDLNHLTLF